MVALPTDVARSGVVARRALETVFRAMVSVLERSLLDKKRPCRATAQVIAALSIGGMVVARSLVDCTHADELRGSCLAKLCSLGDGKKGSTQRQRGLIVRRTTHGLSRDSCIPCARPPAASSSFPHFLRLLTLFVVRLRRDHSVLRLDTGAP
jgi:hypothetical protein